MLAAAAVNLLLGALAVLPLKGLRYVLDRAVLTKIGLVGPYVGVEDELEYWVVAVAVTLTPLLLAFALANRRLQRMAGNSRRQHWAAAATLFLTPTVIVAL